MYHTMYTVFKNVFPFCRGASHHKPGGCVMRRFWRHETRCKETQTVAPYRLVAGATVTPPRDARVTVMPPRDPGHVTQTVAPRGAKSCHVARVWRPPRGACVTGALQKTGRHTAILYIYPKRHVTLPGRVVTGTGVTGSATWRGARGVRHAARVARRARCCARHK